jgi:hypothetical protein
MAEHWSTDYNRLELDRGALTGDDRKQMRSMRARRSLCNRAMRAAVDGRPFDAGDPRTGQPWPPGQDVWDAHQHGLEEAEWIARWQAERRNAAKMAELSKQARAVLKPIEQQRRQEAKERELRLRWRRYRTTRVLAFVAPVWTRRVRRWCGLTQMPRRPKQPA